jgi:DNA-binding NarL/FixJ family response regulator
VAGVSLRVVIADDHPLTREGVRAFLEMEDIQVLGEASNGLELLSLLEECSPDVAVVDASMPEMDGVEAAKLIHERFPQVHVLMLSAFDEPERVAAALEAGAEGYVLKDRDASHLLQALRALAAGYSVVDRRLLGH